MQQQILQPAQASDNTTAPHNIMPTAVSSKPKQFNLMRDNSCSSAEMKKSCLVSSAKRLVAAANPSAQKRSQRHIVWNEDVVVRCVEHVNDMSDQEVDAVWWHREDFRQMKIDFAVTVRMIMGGMFTGDDDEHCSRGLEYRTRVSRISLLVTECIVKWNVWTHLILFISGGSNSKKKQ